MILAGRRHRWARVPSAVVVIAALAVTTTACGSSDDADLAVSAADDEVEADWSYVIPAGTGERIDRGEAVEILPAEIDARVGEVIRIVNEDDRGHVVGPFYVGANETVSQQFTSAGTFIGACSVHPSGEIELVVASG